jgi:hypothetical protein
MTARDGNPFSLRIPQSRLHLSGDVDGEYSTEEVLANLVLVWLLETLPRYSVAELSGASLADLSSQLRDSIYRVEPF